MTLFYLLILIIVVGGGAILWIMMTEKKKESPPPEQKISTEPHLSPQDMLNRLGLGNPKSAESKLSFPEPFQKTSGANVSPHPVQNPALKAATIPASTQAESELSLKYDELLAEQKELKTQYGKLENLFAEKSLGLEKSERTLTNELKNQKEFNKIKDILEKEIKDAKDKIRDLQTELSTAQTETQTQLKRVSQLEEKVKKLEMDVLTSEAAINDGQAGIQLARKHATELEEKLRSNQNQILEKNLKIEDLVNRLKDLPNIFPGNTLENPAPPIEPDSALPSATGEINVVEKGGDKETAKTAGEDALLPLSPEEKEKIDPVIRPIAVNIPQSEPSLLSPIIEDPATDKQPKKPSEIKPPTEDPQKPEPLP